MLEPSDRTILSGALLAPAGYTFDSAVGTTYGLDLTMLLHIPLYLALQMDAAESSGDGVEVIEALERVAGRLTVFAQAGRIAASGTHFRLYGLLEDAVVEATTPHGAFHPKVWLLRFVADGAPTRMRLLVLSRNMTRARTWDVAVTLDGEVGTSNDTNTAFTAWLRGLPQLAIRRDANDLNQRISPLAGDLERVSWELPEGFDALRLHPSPHGEGWLPGDSDRLAVISPFLRKAGLEALAESTASPAVLISRDEEIARVARRDNSFERTYVLDDMVEDPTEGTSDLDDAPHGLHAKIYLAEVGSRLHVYAGSANATNAAITTGINHEFMVELSGARSQIGGIDEVLEGLQPMLIEASLPEEPEEETDEERLRRELDGARRTLAMHRIHLKCESFDDAWRLTLHTETPLDIDGGIHITAWPITLDEDAFAVDAAALTSGEPVVLRPCSLSALTTFIAFRLTAELEGVKVTMRTVANLDCEGLPESRASAIVTSIIRDRDSFMRYVRLLLHDPDDPAAYLESLIERDVKGRSNGGDSGFQAPILEDLVRAYSRNPERLRLLRRRVDRVLNSPDADDIVPMEFRRTWQVFEDALDRDERKRGEDE